ncbi:bifunctional pyr operon transcriptional regulator/uracil phosphoribosyltransferase PyrR [Homoserinimonas sp. OAct 916]|uniref:bifunctional pyr operon transcriptional regulator/uracil phosphoribosyltransferase PyrR n=1 Tax=Homoserinimonas sp. OAct 916 TaxID=2211450 RepID=UPI000DBE6254|nr:bifunctional pyr operon transcriptional regulator/uracil phosphoribosyltransferase PyrR [Homoserinimonas sp. OAct 916]
MSARIVLQAADITRAVTRIAHEIVEANRGGDDLLLLGIPTRGVPLAQRLHAEIRRIEGSDAKAQVGALDVTLYRDDLGSNPTRTPHPTNMPLSIDGMTVVLVDDVLYSGRTIRAALDALSDLGRPRAVRLAVLVDRGHREFPIRADFVGKNLPSSSKERINVRLTEADGDEYVSIEGRAHGEAGTGDGSR